jgi:hypothetical protein
MIRYQGLLPGAVNRLHAPSPCPSPPEGAKGYERKLCYAPGNNQPILIAQDKIWGAIIRIEVIHGLMVSFVATVNPVCQE